MSTYSELLGIKVKPETKENIMKLTEKLTQAGRIDYKGDVIDYLIQRADLRDLSEEISYGGYLRDLQQQTKRIEEIFVSLAKQNEGNLEFTKKEMQGKIIELQEVVNQLEREKNELEMQLAEEKSKIEELTGLIEVNQKAVNDYSDRIEEQKNTISIMSANMKALEDKVKTLKQLEDTNRKLNQDLTNKEFYLKELTDKVSSLEKSIQEQKDYYEKKIEMQNFEWEKALFEKEREFQNHFQSMADELYKQRDDYISKYDEKLSSLQDKYNTLLEEKQKLEAQLNKEGNKNRND